MKFVSNIWYSAVCWVFFCLFLLTGFFGVLWLGGSGESGKKQLTCLNFCLLYVCWSRCSYSGCELKCYFRREGLETSNRILYLSVHHNEAQFPRYSSEFLVRIEEVTHKCLFSRAVAQESGKKKHPVLTIVTCNLYFLCVCSDCVVTWAGI